ncbi:hypothetical protein CVT26_013787 [Gymnopilus dilepis]|uniref:Peptidase C14 caspase domain-containing protein n=1 Tax=Gymnopilus dilepis TaxID=231916 RepID=A0A409VVU0_9AGAR|nr:hypothetical protein CVT26_013787 [Gymnopilus dilepis]
MWDFGNRDQEKKARSRSKSPQPPQMRSPSPASEPYQYAASSSYPPAPVPSPHSPYYPGDISRSGPLGPPQQYPFPQVIHVIHHSSHHHHHSKHKHKKHRSYSNLQAQIAPPLTPSMSYQSSSSYHSAPVIPPPPQSQHVRFPVPSHEVTQPTVLHKPPPRTRVHSQPTVPTIMPKPSITNMQPLNPNLQYSKCTGRKKALCIGINYRGQANELRGCINDAKNVRRFLIEHGKYDPKDIILLTDDAKDHRALPTRANIIAAMQWLVRHARPHDALFFHYSGHGGQTEDLDGDELDGFDEGMSFKSGLAVLCVDVVPSVIYPLDFKTNGHIVDDEMHDIMVKPLPPQCRLTACHSGTVLDLPYIYSSHGRLKGSQIAPRAQRDKASQADVISWSGCKDGQTSADTFSGGVAVGAMSHVLLTSVLANKPHQTYQELLRSIRLILHPRYSQKPQLGSSHHIDTNLRFVF